MLNAKKNLRTFNKIETVKFCEDKLFNKKNIKHFVPNVNTKKSLYYLENVLTQNECLFLIEQSRQKYSSLTEEFSVEEREGNRLLAIDSNFAEILYDRIKEYIEIDNKIENIKPCGFGVAGKWEPLCLNNCFRYNQYISPSIGFTAHRDATFIENEDVRSVLTVLIYLNDNFDGGDTVFYDTFGPRSKEEIVSDEMSKGFIERFRYKPKSGSILIFNHNMIHEGQKLKKGVKYVIRTDVVFKRTLKPLNYNHKWKKNKDFLLAINYFRKAINYELDGDTINSSIFYQKELAIRQTHVENYEYKKVDL